MARNRMWLFGLAALLVIFASSMARAQEIEVKAAEKAIDDTDPDAVDPNTIKGEDWTLDITFENPEPIVITEPDGEKQVYWYVVYTVTNNTGADRDYVPSFTLFGDNGSVRKAGVFPNVFAAIQKLRKVKFLENAVQMIAIQNAKILVGEDNARTGVAIFAPLERDTNRFTIFIDGLSGLFIERPDRPKEVNPGHLDEGDKIVRLRKSMAVTYDMPGDKWWQNLDQAHFASKKWTWR